MSAINFLTDADGRRKAIVIDLEEFKRLCQSDKSHLVDLLKDVEDIIQIELHKSKPTTTRLEAKYSLKKDGSTD
jgi:hypothetical protein